MKFKTFLLALFLLAGTATAFAGVNDKAKEAKKEKAKTVKVSEPKKANRGLLFDPVTCTVTIQTSKIKSVATVTCDCTVKNACDRAYAGALAATTLR